MTTPRQKQPALKPQDLIVALKIAVNPQNSLSYAELGQQLFMSASEAHAAAKRAETCKLVTRQFDQLTAFRLALQEFIVHGVKYVFPPISGGMTRGMATGIAAPPLNGFFPEYAGLAPVWPDPIGEQRGLSLLPLYPSAPAAARADSRLYEMLALIDAIRAGAAREREIAVTELIKRLT